MKIVNEVKTNSVQPLAGCVCSSGQANARGPWAPIFGCNCSCSGGSANSNANLNKARNS